MRHLAISTAALVLASLGATASAQGLNAGGLRPLRGISAAETSIVERMSKRAHAWIEAERRQMAQTPQPLIDSVLEMEEEIGEDILKVAKRERLDTHDVIMIVLHDVVYGAEQDVEAQMRAEKTSADTQKLAELRSRHEQLKTLLVEVRQNQSVVARQLSTQP